MPDFIYNFIDFWSGPAGKNIIFSVKLLVLSISGILVFFIVFFLVKTTYLWNFELYKEAIRMSALPKGKIPKKWQEILSRMEMPEESARKMAIVEADILVDGVLKTIGYSGETLSEKIEKITSAQLKTISDLQKAHNVRKNILYDPDFNITPEAAKETIERYGKVLKEIDVL